MERCQSRMAVEWLQHFWMSLCVTGAPTCHSTVSAARMFHLIAAAYDSGTLGRTPVSGDRSNSIMDCKAQCGRSFRYKYGWEKVFI